MSNPSQSRDWCARDAHGNLKYHLGQRVHHTLSGRFRLAPGIRELGAQSRVRQYEGSEWEAKMGTTPMSIDFSKTIDARQHPSGNRQTKLDEPVTSDGLKLSAKQIRARARRRLKRGANPMNIEEFNFMYKPVEEWDLEELARGRPRNIRGNFRGVQPEWVTREIHERSMDLFKEAIKTEMNSATPKAMDAIIAMLRNEEVDEKGKPVVPPSTKLDAAKFLLEHVVGKPTVHIENDVSVKLQGILGVVMGNPAETFGPATHGGEEYTVGHMPGVTMAMITQEIDDEVDAIILDDEDEDD